VKHKKQGKQSSQVANNFLETSLKNKRERIILLERILLLDSSSQRLVSQKALQAEQNKEGKT
jgi:hypothetical protein